MTEHDDVIRLLREGRPQATEMELDQIKQRIRRRAAAPSGRKQGMKSRIAILGMLVTGALFSTAGVGLAVSGTTASQTNASVAQYATPTPTPTATPTCTTMPSGGTSPGGGSPTANCSPTPCTGTTMPGGGTSPGGGSSTANCSPTPCTETTSGSTPPAGGTPTADCSPTPEGGVLPAEANSGKTPSSGNGNASGGNAPSGGVSPAGDVSPAGGVSPATASSTQPTRQEAAATDTALPFTGFAAIPVILGGLALLSGGLILRRRTRMEE